MVTSHSLSPRCGVTYVLIAPSNYAAFVPARIGAFCVLTFWWSTKAGGIDHLSIGYNTGANVRGRRLLRQQGNNYERRPPQATQQARPQAEARPPAHMLLLNFGISGSIIPRKWNGTPTRKETIPNWMEHVRHVPLRWWAATERTQPTKVAPFWLQTEGDQTGSVELGWGVGVKAEEIPNY